MTGLFGLGSAETWQFACWDLDMEGPKKRHELQGVRMNMDEMSGNVWGVEDSEGKCSTDGFGFILY